jgi:Catalase-related immune-responsive
LAPAEPSSQFLRHSPSQTRSGKANNSADFRHLWCFLDISWSGTRLAQTVRQERRRNLTSFKEVIRLFPSCRSFDGPRINSNRHPVGISGDPDRYNHREDNDDYTQAGNLFRLVKPDERKRLIENIVNAMRSVPPNIQERQLQHFLKADPEYGKGVAQGLGLPTSASYAA